MIVASGQNADRTRFNINGRRGGPGHRLQPPSTPWDDVWRGTSPPPFPRDSRNGLTCYRGSRLQSRARTQPHRRHTRGPIIIVMSCTRGIARQPHQPCAMWCASGNRRPLRGPAPWPSPAQNKVGHSCIRCRQSCCAHPKKNQRPQANDCGSLVSRHAERQGLYAVQGILCHQLHAGNSHKRAWPWATARGR